LLDKTYYKISEIDKRFGLTLEDIQFLVENKKLKLSFFSPKDNYLIGNQTNAGFIGIGTVTYEGVIGINRNDALSILRKEQVKINTFALLEPENCNDWSGQYPFDVECPNDYICDWVATNPATLKWPFFPARLIPKQTSNSMKMFVNSMAKSLEACSANNNEFMEQFRKYEDKPDKFLRFSSRTIEFRDACILKSDLDNLNQKIGPTEGSPDFSNIFHNLVNNLIQSQPKLSAAKLWRFIKAQFDLENDDIDPDSILREVSDNEIIWEDSEGKDRTMKKRSFLQLYKRLK
jgi:hypothetical protein